MRREIACALAATLMLSNTAMPVMASESVETVAADTLATLEEAYIFCYPLVMMDATKTSATNTEEVGLGGKAPINQVNHAKKLADASFKNVVTPNVDTVYSQTWYDLSEEPIIYIVPEADRFLEVQLMDAWTNTVAAIMDSGTYAFVKEGWEGELPEDVIRVDVPTSMAWTLARVVTGGEEDLPNVYEVQEGMKVLPLSAYEAGGDYEAPKGTYDPENDFVPVEHVESMDLVTFFEKANELLVDNPPAAEDAQVVEEIAAVGVGAGVAFDASVLGDDPAATQATIVTESQQMMRENVEQYMTNYGVWRFYGAPIGDFGTEYLYRALIARIALGANKVENAIYPKTDADSDGEQLDGANTYVMHFDSLPPCKESGFWSITAYGNDNFLIDNPLNRYCVNDRSGLQMNDDGTLDVILSVEEPEDSTNWLPICDDIFHLYMRIYEPDTGALEGWVAPTITKVE